MVGRLSDADVFGELLRAQYKAGERQLHEIVERDDGHLVVNHALLYFSGYDEWTPEERRALKLVNGRVLDVGCGAGRHALYLQSQGIDVTGLDSSKGAIEVCRKRGLKKTVRMPVERLGGFRAESFDTITMFFNNFGLLQSARKAKPLLRQLHRITAPGGRIIAHCAKPADRAYAAMNRKRGRMSGQLRIRHRFGSLIGPWFDYLLVSPEEMKTLLTGTGWRLERLIHDRARQRYVALIRRHRA